MSPTDSRSKFLFENLAVRGELVRLHGALQSVLGKHEYPAPLQVLLGEALAAAALLAGTLKFEGMLILQAKGEGPLTLLMAECSHDGAVRAIARWEGEVPDGPLVQLLGGGYLAITIDPPAHGDRAAQRYQGIVPLDGLSLAECLEHYFRQSEQLATRLWLVAGPEGAAGLLLQELPETAGVPRDADGWNRLCRLTDTLTAGELLSLPVESLLVRLFHQEDVRLFPDNLLHFACSCSAERTLAALRSLGHAELRAILAEQGGVIETTCQFCHETRRFRAADLGDLS